jgi:titin
MIVEPGNATAIMYFTSPAQTGGAPISNYQYSINNGQSWVTRTPASVSSPIIFTGLTNGTRYMLKIRAVNAAGPGMESWTFVVTPRTVPSAPIITSVQPGNGYANLVIQAPSNTGGASLSNYEFSLDDGLLWKARTPAHIGANLTLTGLVNGISYPVRVRAVNEAGAGPASSMVSVRPRASSIKPSIQSSVGLYTSRTDSSVRVFPNPVVNGTVQIEIPGAGDFISTITLLSHDGRVVRIFPNKEWKSGKTNLDLSDVIGLASGRLTWTLDHQIISVQVIWK